MDAPESFQAAVGRFLYAYREAHELTLDQIAIAARRFGVTWGTQSVRNIQTGSAAPTLPTLITLALALNSLTGEKLTLSAMLGDAQSISPPTALDVPFSRHWVNQVLSGGQIYVADVSADLIGGAARSREILSHAPAALDTMLDFARHLPPGFGINEIERFGNKLNRSTTLAERRAAKRLGIPASALIYWGAHLWGRSIDEEAQARAGEGSSPQSRGVVTRELTKEIASRLGETRAEHAPSEPIEVLGFSIAKSPEHG